MKKAGMSLGFRSKFLRVADLTQVLTEIAKIVGHSRARSAIVNDDPPALKMRRFQSRSTKNGGLAAVKLENGELSAGVGACVDSYSAGPIGRGVPWSMSVDKRDRELRAASKERFSYPHHVLVGLIVKRNSRADAGVHEQIASNLEADRHRRQQCAMMIGNCRYELLPE